LNGVVYDVKDTLNQKQNGLLAGENITITKGLKSDTISATGGTTIDSTTDLSCNTLTTVGNATIGGILTVGSETLDNKISNAINGKQNTITARNNLTITNDVLDVDEDVVTNSLVIRPSFLKESYTPSVAGEIRATTLTIDDYLNGVVYDVKETLNQKQKQLVAGNNITITTGVDKDTISATGSGTTIDSTTDLSCNTLTTVGNATIGGTLTIGGETLDSKLSGKQDKIDPTTDLSCNTLTTTGDVSIGGQLSTHNFQSFTDNNVIDLELVRSYRVIGNFFNGSGDFVSETNGIFTFSRAGLYLVNVTIPVQSDLYNNRVNWRLRPLLNNGVYFRIYPTAFAYTRGISSTVSFCSLTLSMLVGRNVGEVMEFLVDWNKDAQPNFFNLGTGLVIDAGSSVIIQYVEAI